jgi:hypothetical protein
LDTLQLEINKSVSHGTDLQWKAFHGAAGHYILPDGNIDLAIAYRLGKNALAMLPPRETSSDIANAQKTDGVMAYETSSLPQVTGRPRATGKGEPSLP